MNDRAEFATRALGFLLFYVMVSAFVGAIVWPAFMAFMDVAVTLTEVIR